MTRGNLCTGKDILEGGCHLVSRETVYRVGIQRGVSLDVERRKTTGPLTGAPCRVRTFHRTPFPRFVRVLSGVRSEETSCNVREAQPLTSILEVKVLYRDLRFTNRCWDVRASLRLTPPVCDNGTE